MLVQILFLIFATLLVASALGLITARNPVYSALFLVLCFCNSAVIWLLTGAEFLAIVLVLVYVGAVMVLFLFVVMMLDINLAELRRGFTRFAWLGWITALAVIAEIVGVVWSHGVTGLDVGRSMVSEPENYSNTQALGLVLYTRYVYFFEAAGVILLVAMIGAIVMTLQHKADVRRQNIAAQVARRRADAVELVKVKPGQGLS